MAAGVNEPNRKALFRNCDFMLDLGLAGRHIVQCGMGRRPMALPYVF
jgi:hypothetical protein